jgi:hypothetical protein
MQGLGPVIVQLGHPPGARFGSEKPSKPSSRWIGRVRRRPLPAPTPESSPGSPISSAPIDPWPSISCGDPRVRV